MFADSEAFCLCVQIARLRSELDIVRGNIKVMSEMLTEMVPGQEDASDLELLQVWEFSHCAQIFCTENMRINDAICLPRAAEHKIKANVWVLIQHATSRSPFFSPKCSMFLILTTAIKGRCKSPDILNLNITTRGCSNTSTSYTACLWFC